MIELTSDQAWGLFLFGVLISLISQGLALGLLRFWRVYKNEIRSLRRARRKRDEL